MSRPWKHPKSGVYWLRKAVPVELRAIVGKREEKLSLNTKDPAEAKRRHAVALAKIDERWSNLRSGPRAISEREAHEIAAPIYDWWIDQHRDHPSKQKFWDVDLGNRVFAPWTAMSSSEPMDTASFLQIKPGDVKVLELEDWCIAGAKQRLEAGGRNVDQESHRLVAKAIATAIQRASPKPDRRFR